MLFQILEALFLVGLIVLAIGLIWLVIALIRRSKHRVWLPVIVSVCGLAAVVGPSIYTRFGEQVDLGARERVVENERHLSLTGWDGKSYEFLSAKTDTVLLQMANADVTDTTLQLLKNFDRLRELDLNDTQVSDSGLAVLGNLNTLQVLRMRGTKITDDGFRQHLLPLTELKNLDVRNTSLSPQVIDEWKSALPGRRAMR